MKDFDRDGSAWVRLSCFENDAHASFADLANDSVGTNPFGEIFDGLSIGSIGCKVSQALSKDVPLQPIGYSLIMIQQAEEFLPERWIPGAFTLEDPVTLRLADPA